MNATGIVRIVDRAGRIVIPALLRETMWFAKGDELEIFVEGDGSIVLRKYTPCCIFCGEGGDDQMDGYREQNVPVESEADQMITYRGKNVCAACARELGNWAKKRTVSDCKKRAPGSK